jgi:BASS family bile acid:Na+ symporter
MGLLETPAAALAWIGRQGTRAVALSVFAGLALPWLAAAAKPAFTPSLFVLLCLAFLRAHWPICAAMSGAPAWFSRCWPG